MQNLELMGEQFLRCDLGKVAKNFVAKKQFWVNWETAYKRF